MSTVQFIKALTNDEGSDKASELFRHTFGEDESGVWSAPGRVNLIGEHTDYNAGLCLPIALPHRTFIALKPRTDGIVRVVSDVDPTSFQEIDLNGLEARGVHDVRARLLVDKHDEQAERAGEREREDGVEWGHRVDAVEKR